MNPSIVAILFSAAVTMAVGLVIVVKNFRALIKIAKNKAADKIFVSWKEKGEKLYGEKYNDLPEEMSIEEKSNELQKFLIEFFDEVDTAVADRTIASKIKWRMCKLNANITNQFPMIEKALFS